MLTGGREQGSRWGTMFPTRAIRKETADHGTDFVLQEGSPNTNPRATTTEDGRPASPVCQCRTGGPVRTVVGPGVLGPGRYNYHAGWFGIVGRSQEQTPASGEKPRYIGEPGPRGTASASKCAVAARLGIASQRPEARSQDESSEGHGPDAPIRERAAKAAATGPASKWGSRR